MTFSTTRPAKKEHTMKKRAYLVVLAVLVALMAASGASAKRMLVRANVKQAHHSLVKQAHKTAYKTIDRRAGGNNF
jgi:hypothetical protein